LDKPLKALTYMTRFRCIGPECEDHCCQSWRIHLDRDDYLRLQKCRKKSPVVNQHFAAAVQRNQDSDSSQKHYAFLNFRPEDGHCFFEQSGLCAIHRDFGEAALPKTCATYPRMTRVYGDFYEQGGSLSCPEVARECLLKADAMELVDWDWSHLTQLDIAPGSDGNDFFGIYAQQVRDAFIGLYRLSGYNNEERTYFTLYLARKISSFFSREVTVDPERRLKRAFSQLQDPVFRGRIRSNMDDSGEPRELSTNFLAMILLIPGKKVRYNDLVARVFASYEGTAELDLKDPADPTRPLLVVWPAYRERLATLNKLYGKRIDMYFGNFCRNFWYEEHLKDAPDPLSYVAQLILFFAVVKFLFFSHPNLVPLLTGEVEEEAAQELLDRTIVEVVQVFMRSYTHNAGFKQYIRKAMRMPEMQDLAELTSLLSF